jgi:hypothetical protein
VNLPVCVFFRWDYLRETLVSLVHLDFISVDGLRSTCICLSCK